MSDVERRLAEFKEDIEEARVELNRLEGEKISIMKRLKEEYDLGTIEAAKEHWEKLKVSAKETKERLDKVMAKIEEKYAAAQ